ncbi:MAG: cyclic-phosphate processing receiver domain-containing protein [Planctomycetota bacterium]|jgi:hypothetical protein
MEGVIAILEDDPGRVAIMSDCLSVAGAQGRARWFRSAPAMIEWLDAHLDEPALISLDHDLLYLPDPNGELIDPGDGRDVANFLATRQPVCPVIVHSSNEPRASEMAVTLQQAGWHVTRVFPIAGPDWIDTQWLGAVRCLLAAPAGHR